MKRVTYETAKSIDEEIKKIDKALTSWEWVNKAADKHINGTGESWEDDCEEVGVYVKVWDEGDDYYSYVPLDTGIESTMFITFGRMCVAELLQRKQQLEKEFQSLEED